MIYLLSFVHFSICIIGHFLTGLWESLLYVLETSPLFICVTIIPSQLICLLISYMAFYFIALQKFVYLDLSIFSFMACRFGVILHSES